QSGITLENYSRVAALSGNPYAAKTIAGLYLYDPLPQHAAYRPTLPKNIERAGYWALVAHELSVYHNTAEYHASEWTNFRLPNRDWAKAIQTALGALGLYDGAID